MSLTRVYVGFAVFAAAWMVHLWLHPPPVPVLLLHDVNARRAPADFWTLHPDRFREILDLVDALGLHGLSLAEAQAHVRGTLSAERAASGVLITIDDGFASADSLVGPELARRGHAGTFFVVGAWGPPAYVSTEGRKRLIAAGHDIGSHSLTHASLAVRAGADPAQEEERIARELSGSVAQLAGELRRPVTAIAYPRGEWDAVTKRRARDSYALAFTTDTGYLTPGTDAMECPRFQLNWDTPLSWIENYLTSPQRARRRNLGLLAGIVLLALAGARMAELNRRRVLASCHTEPVPPT